MALHADVLSIHRFAHVAAADPGAVGAGKGWVDTSSGPPYRLKIRNAADTGWEDVGGAGGYTDPLTTRGDLVRRGASATERVALGAAGYGLASDGTDAVWRAQYATLTFVIDGGGSAITTGVKGDLVVPDDYTIVQATALADVSGSLVVDIWRDTYAAYPPVDADSITASAPVTISAATKSQDSTLASWTTSLSAGDILRYNVDSCASITRLTIALRVRRR